MQKGMILVLVAVFATVQGKILTSETFEHTTQASTGQTTGIWVVRFCSNSDPRCQYSLDSWSELKEEMLDYQIFLADVDVDASRNLAQRFEINESPTFVMLRRRKLFLKSGENDIEELRDWILEGWSREGGLPVPPEKGGSQAVAEYVAALRQQVEKLLKMDLLTDGGSQGAAKLVLSVLGGCLGLLLLMLVRSIVSGGRKKKD